MLCFSENSTPFVEQRVVRRLGCLGVFLFLFRVIITFRVPCLYMFEEVTQLATVWLCVVSCHKQCISLWFHAPAKSSASFLPFSQHKMQMCATVQQVFIYIFYNIIYNFLLQLSIDQSRRENGSPCAKTHDGEHTLKSPQII